MDRKKTHDGGNGGQGEHGAETSQCLAWEESGTSPEICGDEGDIYRDSIGHHLINLINQWLTIGYVDGTHGWHYRTWHSWRVTLGWFREWAPVTQDGLGAFHQSLFFLRIHR